MTPKVEIPDTCGSTPLAIWFVRLLFTRPVTLKTLLRPMRN